MTGDSRVLKSQDNGGRLERWLVVLIALHSYAVGIGLMFLPEFGARMGGWEEVVPLFFARQAGVFHLIVATAYLLEYFRHGTVTLLLITKTTAFVFLGGHDAVRAGRVDRPAVGGWGRSDGTGRLVGPPAAGLMAAG